jgi:hypothetical protein
MHLHMSAVTSDDLSTHAEFRWDGDHSRRRLQRVSTAPPNRHDSHWRAIWSLIGHLIATALVFISLFTLGWLVSFSFHHLQSIHPFPEPIFRFISLLEIALFYLDAGASVVVLLVGVVRYIAKMLEGR